MSGGRRGAKRAVYIRLAITLVVIAALTLVSIWILVSARKSGWDEERQNKRSEPDYIVENFRYFKMNPDGTPQYEAIGTKLTHFPIEDSYLIDNPVIYSLSDDAQLQTVKSLEAYIEDFNTKVHMRDNVVMDREPLNGKKPFRLTSEYVLIYPDDEIMTSDRDVMIQDDKTVMTGIGMYSNNVSRELELFYHVKVRYERRRETTPWTKPEAEEDKEENEENPA